MDAADIVIIGAGAGAKLIWASVPGRSVAPWSSRSSWAATARSVPRNSLAPVFCNAAAVKLSSRPLTIRSLRAAACP